jgi:predicted RNase H-like HicB family nuclease
MKCEYAVVYEWAGKNYSAYVPDLPGCVSTGRTLADVKRNIKEAISGHVKTLREFGEPVPKPMTRVGSVEVAA